MQGTDERHPMEGGRETMNLIASDKVEGTAVRNRQGEKLGTIERVMIDKQSGQVAFAIMSFGGFLGIGEKYHPLPWEILTYDTDEDAYVVNLDRSTLENAPTISDENEFFSPGYGNQVHDYYRGHSGGIGRA